MKEPQNRVIDERDYQIRIMGPKRQLKTLKFIAKTIGKPLGVLAQAEDEFDENGKKKPLFDNSKLIGLFIQSATENLDDEAIIDQFEILLQFVERKKANGYAQVQMETDFHGELDHLFKVIGAVLEVNFGRFLGVSTGLISGLQDRFANSNAPSSTAVQ